MTEQLTGAPSVQGSPEAPDMKLLPHPEFIRTATTDALREAFLLTKLFCPGEIQLQAVDLDRVIVGGVIPTTVPLILKAPPEVHASYFCERRELGIINIGSEGSVTVDDEVHSLGCHDALYIGRGCREIEFASTQAADPASFYLVSYPAHASYTTTRVAVRDVAPLELGAQSTANKRRLYKMIEPKTVQSCQLVMGFTELMEGSIWNTMPPHTHERRSEVYLYFNVPDDAAVFHFMGEPEQTRHLIVHDRDVVLSPPWSIHSGAGTSAYSFVWAMGGENQDFNDMDAVAIPDLK